MSAESQMMHELIDQVRWNCTVLTGMKELAQTPDEISKVEKAIEDNQGVIARAKETLKTVDIYDNS